MTFSEIIPQEENRLYTLDKQYEEEEDQSFQVTGKKINSKLLVEAMCFLPKEKCITVLIYYFFNKYDEEISQLLDIPHSIVQV